MNKRESFTLDFSTVHTKILHDKPLCVLNWNTELTFKEDTSYNIVVNNLVTDWLKPKSNSWICVRTCYFQASSDIFHQILQWF